MSTTSESGRSARWATGLWRSRPASGRCITQRVPGATDYWRVLHGEGRPSPHHAGILAARLVHLERHATALIAAIEQEAQIAPTAYPAIWEQITALRTALGTAAAAEMTPLREAM